MRLGLKKRQIAQIRVLGRRQEDCHYSGGGWWERQGWGRG